MEYTDNGVPRGTSARLGPLTVTCPVKECAYVAFDPNLRAPAVAALAEHFRTEHHDSWLRMNPQNVDKRLESVA